MVSYGHLEQNQNVNQGYSMCWSKELAVFVVGYVNELSISSNGIDWTLAATLNGTWRSIAWSPKLGLFVAVSNSRSFIITSPDGLNWSEIAVSFRYSGIVWSDIGIFLAVGTGGYIMYSNDGINWVENVLSGVLQCVCWSDELGIFVVVGNNSVYTSTLKGRPPTMHNTFDSEFNSIDEDGTWNFNSLTISGDLVIGTTNVITEIGTKQDTINDGDLTIAKTSGLQTALNNKYDDTGGTIDGNVDISGDLSVSGITTTSTLNASTIDSSGNITSPNWNVLKPVFDLTNRFPNSSSATQVTVATNVVITGNFILHYYNSGFKTSTGVGTFQLYAVPNAGGSNILIGDLSQYFNTASFHLAFSQSNYVTNVPAGTYSLLLTRDTTALRHDANDFLTVIMEMVPF